MKKITLLFFIGLFFFSTEIKAQTMQHSIANKEVENAKYLKEDITKLLQKNISYPKDAIHYGFQGDVILSFIVDKNGAMKNTEIVSTPSDMLSRSAIISFNNIENEWSPCKENGIPVDKKYFVVFRYSIWMDKEPPKYEQRAEKFVKKEKYEKALKYYDLAIKENKYNYKLYDSRIEIEKMLGEAEKAKEDSLQSDKLKNSIISVVDIAAIGVTRVEKVTTVTTRRIY